MIETKSNMTRLLRAALFTALVAAAWTMFPSSSSDANQAQRQQFRQCVQSCDARASACYRSTQNRGQCQRIVNQCKRRCSRLLRR